MKGPTKQYYVGMLNFLGAACRIHHEIKQSYVEFIRKKAEGGTETEQVPDVVYRMFPDKKALSDAEIKKREEAEIERLKNLRKNGRYGEFAQDKAQEKGIQPDTEPEQKDQPQRPAEKPKERNRERYEDAAQRAGTQLEEQPQQPQQPQVTQPAEEPVVEKPKKPIVIKKPQSKPVFKQYVPQLSIGKGFSKPMINRMTRK